MPNTRKEARQGPNTSRPRGSLNQPRTAPRDKRSDSGYSSHTSSLPVGNIPATAPAPPVATEAPQPAATPAPKRAKSIVHPSGAEQTRPRSRSTTGTVGECDLPDCQHATCAAARARAAQHYATLRAQMGQPLADAAMAYYQRQMQMQVQQQQYYHVANPQVAQSYAVPVLQPAPTRRPVDLSRAARPVSFAGYPHPIRQSVPAQGPPPSMSAYQNLHYTTAQHQQQYQPQMGAYQPGMRYSPTSIFPAIGTYPGSFPVVTSPPSPSFPQPATVPSNYNTRVHQPGTEPSTRPNPTTPSFYAKRRTPRTSPMASPRPDRNSAAISTASDSSDFEYSSEEDRRHHRRSARDSRPTSFSYNRNSRPQLHRHAATSPTLRHHSTSQRDSLQHQRDRHRQAALDDLQSSDNMDSDRTQRAQVHERPRPSTRISHHRGESSGSSRRPSLSTTASSGRTRATTLSDGSAQGAAYVTVQRKGHRDVTYLSHVEQAALKKSQEREAYVKAYQDSKQGPPAPDLTAETIRQAGLGWQKRHSLGSKQHSRRSSGESRSHRSMHSRSRSNASQGQEGFRVELQDGNIVHAPLDCTITMQAANGEEMRITATPTATERPEGSRRSSYAGGGKDGDRERGERGWSFRRGSKDGSEGSRRGR